MTEWFQNNPNPIQVSIFTDGSAHVGGNSGGFAYVIHLVSSTNETIWVGSGWSRHGDSRRMELSAVAASLERFQTIKSAVPEPLEINIFTDYRPVVLEWHSSSVERYSRIWQAIQKFREGMNVKAHWTSGDGRHILADAYARNASFTGMKYWHEITDMAHELEIVRAFGKG